MPADDKNLLAYGDNLDVLKRYVREESVDLVYLDPPFNSNADYNILYAEQDGTRAAAQIKAFKDTWRWDQAAVAAYEDVVEAGGQPALAMRAFRTLLGTSNLLAYLAMMAPRLKQLREVLKPSGSIYLHCDPTASSYLKILMDAVFGPENFRNEIVWRRWSGHNKLSRQFGPIHDTLLFYSRTPSFYFRPGRRPVMRGYVRDWFTSQDEHGPYRTNMLTGPGIRKGVSGLPWRGFDPTSIRRHWAIPRSVRDVLPPDASGWTSQETLEFLYEQGLVYIPRDGKGQPKYKQYVGEGTPYQDIWACQPYTQGTVYGSEEAIDEDVKWLEHNGERLGYPTQKPLGLLERIITSSCPEDGTVLDPFCGCGTAVVAAQHMGRRWVGIDITHHATTLIKSRLVDDYGPSIGDTIRVLGEPTTPDGAAELAATDPYQFQAWALGLVGARPINGVKKGADRGIDGNLYFHESEGGTTRRIVFSVKGGNLAPTYLRDLRGVIEREEAEIGVLISMREPSKKMRAEAADAGSYVFKGMRYPRLQLRTVAELLVGLGVEYPPTSETVFRPTIWPLESIPSVPRKRRQRRPKVAAAQSTWTTPEREPTAASAVAATLREGYAHRVAEEEESVPEPSVNPEAQRSPRTSMRGR
jgi:DNA modification methylase